MIEYGDVMLSLSDAVYADSLDAHGPMLLFDPSSPAGLTVQDAIFAESGRMPDIFAGWYCIVEMGITQPRWAGSDSAYAEYARAMRNALLLPLSEPFLKELRDLWEAWGLPEAQRRIAEQEKRARLAREFGEASWVSADLLQEVESVCGAGRPFGRQVAFHCPFPGHARGDKHASLHVDPAKRTWICRACQRGGGVVDWRRQAMK